MSANIPYAPLFLDEIDQETPFLEEKLAFKALWREKQEEIIWDCYEIGQRVGGEIEQLLRYKNKGTLNPDAYKVLEWLLVDKEISHVFIHPFSSTRSSYEINGIEIVRSGEYYEFDKVTGKIWNKIAKEQVI